MFYIFFVKTFIILTIWPIKFSIPMHLVILKHSLIFFTVFSYHSAFSFNVAHIKLTFISCTIIPFYFSFTMPQAFQKITCIFKIFSCLSTKTICISSNKLTLVFNVISINIYTFTFKFIILKIPFIKWSGIFNDSTITIFLTIFKISFIIISIFIYLSSNTSSFIIFEITLINTSRVIYFKYSFWLFKRILNFHHLLCFVP